MLTAIAQLTIGATGPCRRVPVPERPQAHVLAGHCPVRDFRRRSGHARGRPRELPLRLWGQPGASPTCRSTSALAVVALAIGGGLAWWSGRKAAMTSMPQMVALYNGMGGGAAGAIAAVELFGGKAQGPPAGRHLVGALIGAVSLSGSLIAWAKLDGRPQEAAAGSGAAGHQREWSMLGDSRRRRLHRAFVTGRGSAHRAPPSDDGHVLRRRAGPRHPDDAADRRGRHAGGDLDLQRLHRGWRSVSRASYCRSPR